MTVEPGTAVEVDFTVWYAATAAPLTRRVTAAVGDPLLGQEATAEAFTRAYEQWRTVSRMDSPEGWVFRVAVNVTRRRWRQRRLEIRALARTMSAVLGRTTDSTGEYHDDVHRAVRRLSRRQRAAVRLRYWDDLTESEVAVRMGVTVGTVSALLSSARARLRSVLDDPSAGGDR